MTKKLFIIILPLLVIVLSIAKAHAQQDPQYTQYMYIMNVVNPAYAGSKESLSITALYRNQWTGLEGNPVTFTFSAHSPITKKVGLGLSAIKDELGPVSETNVFADFSYTIQVAKSLKLAFGLKAGASFHDVGLTNLELQEENDPLFSEDINNTNPNIGVGAFLYSEKFYFGLSVPNMLKSVHLDENGLKYGSETNHFFATAGYVFQVSEIFKLKPSVMVKSAFDAPVSYDANLNALFYDRFELGASYRLNDSFSGLIGFQITPNINDRTKRVYTRDQLLVSGMLDGEKIHIIVNHWPSRSGGEELSRPKRIKAAQLNKRIMDSLFSDDPYAKIITMGDFNDDPNNSSIKEILKAKNDRVDMKMKELYNPMEELFKKGLGTLAYRDGWNLFDQIIISTELLKKDFSSYRFYKAGIFNKSYLETPSGQYKGYPFRSFANGYTGGYSDHFPVFIYLIKEKNPKN